MHKILLALTFALTSATALSTAAFADPVKIKFASWNSAQSEASDRAMVESFNASHPDIQVEYVNYPGTDSYFGKISLQASSGDAPDVISHFSDWMPVWHQAGFFEDLSGYIKNDPDGAAIDTEVLGKQLFTSVDGQVDALPWVTTALMVYYNKSLFDEMGIAVPTADWTFDDLMATASKFVKKDDAGKQTQWGMQVYTEYDYFLRWIPVPFGGYSFAKDPLSCGFAEPGTVAAMEFYSNLFRDGVAVPFSDTQGVGDQLTWQAGHVAMMVHQQAAINQLMSGSKFNWQIQLVPLGADGKRTTRGASAGVGISKASANKDAAWQFVKYMTFGEGAEVLANSGVGGAKRSALLASLDAMASSDAVDISEGSFDAASKAVYVDSLNDAHALPSPSNIGEIETALAPYWDELRLGTRPTTDIVADMQTACSALIAQAQ